MLADEEWGGGLFRRSSSEELLLVAVLLLHVVGVGGLVEEDQTADIAKSDALGMDSLCQRMDYCGANFAINLVLSFVPGNGAPTHWVSLRLGRSCRSCT